MSFVLFTPVFAKVDAATTSFVSNISTASIVALTPVVTIGLTVAFMCYAILIIRGAVDMPIMEFLAKSIRIGIITSIGLAGGLYQSDIADAIRTLPDDVALALIAAPATGTGAAGLIDGAAGKGFDQASIAFDQSGFFSSDGIVYGLFGIIIIIATAVFVSIGAAYLLLAKIAVAILAGLGPIFILALLFQPTVRFFEMWTAQIINYVLLIVIFASCFGLMTEIYSNYMGSMKLDGSQNVAYALGGAFILSIAMVVVLLQIPGIASGLAGGVGLSFIHEMRSIRSGANAAGRATSAAARGGKAAVKAGVGAAREGVSKAAGYFKGKKAA